MSRPLATESGFRAIGHPLRRQLMDYLRAGERTVGDVHEAFSGVSRPTLSDHLRILRETGLLKQRRRGPYRMYRVDAAPLREVMKWLRPYQ